MWKLQWHRTNIFKISNTSCDKLQIQNFRSKKKNHTLNVQIAFAETPNQDPTSQVNHTFRCYICIAALRPIIVQATKKESKTYKKKFVTYYIRAKMHVFTLHFKFLNIKIL